MRLVFLLGLLLVQPSELPSWRFTTPTERVNMHIVDHHEFLELPPGTPFSFGPRFFFGGLLIKSDSIIGEGCWGFWALDPCWIDGGTSDADDDIVLEDMSKNGASYPMETYVSKYMSYDGDDFECFLIFEQNDIEKLKSIMGNGDWD